MRIFAFLNFTTLKNYINLLMFFVMSSINTYGQTVYAQILKGPTGINSKWKFAGNATFINNNNELQLTSASKNQFGAVFLNEKFNLNQCNNWSIEFEFKIPSSNRPADGFAFWYLDAPPSNFVAGSGLGIPKNAKGLVVAFDSYDNATTGKQSAVQVFYGENYFEENPDNIRQDSGNYNSQVARKLTTEDWFIGAPNIIGNSYKKVIITYVDGMVTVNIGGYKIYENFRPTIYGGAENITEGYFGFSASTGMYFSQHLFKNIKLMIDKIVVKTNKIKPELICIDSFKEIDLKAYENQIVANTANLNFVYYNQNGQLITNPRQYRLTKSEKIKIEVKSSSGNTCSELVELDFSVQFNPVIAPINIRS